MKSHPRSIALLVGLSLFFTGYLLHAGSPVPLYHFSLFAGNETNGGSDGVGVGASFSGPQGVAINRNGTLFVADSGNNIIRVISPEEQVSTLAGTAGVRGSDDGIGAAASFYAPHSVAVDSNGILYVADTGNDTIRKIATNGEVTTLAGLATQSGNQDGNGTNARFNLPEAVAVDETGNVYVADAGNYSIRKITQSGVVTTLAGGGRFPQYQDGVGTNALFAQMSGIAVDGGGNVYVADAGNSAIRKITPSGIVSSMSGIDAGNRKTKIFALTHLALDGRGNIYYDSSQSDLQILTSAGMILTILSVSPLDMNENYSIIAGLASDPSGNLFLSLSDNTIWNAALIPTKNQSISFGKTATQGYGSPPFSVMATASSRLPVSLASSNASVATVSGNTVSIVGAGTTTLIASQAGDSFFKPVTATKILPVAKAAQTISFGTIKPQTFGAPSLTLPATCSSGYPIVYSSSMTNVATVSGNVVNITGGGVSTITASVSASANYNAVSVRQVLMVAKATQTITFPLSTASIPKTGNFTLSATSSSGLPVSFQSSNPKIISISGTTATLLGKGKVIITATQAGDGGWKAAPSVAVPLLVQ